jgi:8-hydroxy-5-deazaflavin:NADPH oxidoreductase
MPCSTDMRIGIFGATGPAGSAFAVRMAAVGYDVVVGSRSLDRARQVVADLTGRWPDRDLPIEPAVNEDAAQADVVVIATPWDSAATTAHAHATTLEGKVVVSMANALVRVGTEFEPLIPPRGSVAAHVQAAVPKSRVVAAFHHLPAKELAQLDHPLESDVLVCGDDQTAVRVVMEIAAKIPGCRPLDAGELSNATAIEAFTAVLLQLNVRYKTRVAPRVTGIRT